MSSVVASINTVRHVTARMSHGESSGSKSATGTVDSERCVTGFPVGFGGWTAAKMYERSINVSKYASNDTDDAAASAARQEVGPTLRRCFFYRRRCLFSWFIGQGL